MKKLFLFLLSVLAVGWVQAQDVQDRRPSAEEQALKQTEMIVRELRIDDSVQYHQLFDMHLRYARQYEDGCTRAQWLEKMESMNKDLQTILTPEQYEAFMNKQVQEGPHGPRPQVGRFGYRPEGAARPVSVPQREQEQP